MRLAQPGNEMQAKTSIGRVAFDSWDRRTVDGGVRDVDQPAAARGYDTDAHRRPPVTQAVGAQLLVDKEQLIDIHRHTVPQPRRTHRCPQLTAADREVDERAQLPAPGRQGDTRRWR